LFTSTLFLSRVVGGFHEKSCDKTGQVSGSEMSYGFKVFAVRVSAPLRSSAARAAHREQARSYICFGPVDPEATARGPLVLASISSRKNKAVACDGTDVTGRNRCRSELARDAPRGRRSIA
jgi:hypothetical protein